MTERNNNILSIMNSIMDFLEQRVRRLNRDSVPQDRLNGSLLSRLRNRWFGVPVGRDTARNRARASAERDGTSRNNRARRRREEILSGQNGEQDRAGQGAGNDLPSTNTSPYIGAILNLFTADLHSHLEAGGSTTDNRAAPRPGRTLRFIIPQRLSNELRTAVGSNGEIELSLNNVIFEVQIYYDVLDGPFANGPVTATREELSKTKMTRITKADECSECPICMLNFVKNQKARQLPCEHRFHARCVDKWLLAHSNRCPVCRAEVSK
jgi:hypothetical protein